MLSIHEPSPLTTEPRGRYNNPLSFLFVARSITFLLALIALLMLSQPKVPNKEELHRGGGAIVKGERRRNDTSSTPRQSTFQETIVPNKCWDDLNATNITWVKRHDGSYDLSMAPSPASSSPLCRLKRYTAQDAKQCLAGKHLMAIGDSVSRYLFLSLVHLVENGEYLARYGPSPQCAHVNENGQPACVNGSHHILIHRTYFPDSHGGVQREIGGSSDGGIFNGRLECFASRNPLNGFTDQLRYVSKEGIRLSYLGERGKGDVPQPISGWNSSGCADRATCRFTNETIWSLETLPKHFSVPLNEGAASDGIFQSVYPDLDVVVYNRGLHGGLRRDIAEQVFHSLNDWVRPGGQCFWQSTTQPNDGGPPRGTTSSRVQATDEIIQREAIRGGCRTFDTARLTKTLLSLDPKTDNVWLDNVHFLPWVNEEINNWFLNVLCGNA